MTAIAVGGLVLPGEGWQQYSNLQTFAFLFSDDPKWEIREAHLNYASANNRLKTNQPLQDIFISSMLYIVWLLFISSYNLSVPNDSRCILSFLCWSGFGVKTQKKHSGYLPPSVTDLPPPPSFPTNHVDVATIN